MLKPAANEAVRRIRAAEAELSFARDSLGTVAANVILGESSEEDLLAVERAIEDAERDVRRWTAAARALDGERGVIRDSHGNRL